MGLSPEPVEGAQVDGVRIELNCRTQSWYQQRTGELFLVGKAPTHLVSETKY